MPSFTPRRRKPAAQPEPPADETPAELDPPPALIRPHDGQLRVSQTVSVEAGSGKFLLREGQLLAPDAPVVREILAEFPWLLKPAHEDE